MYSYRLDGAIVVITASGESPRENREAVLREMRADARVPRGALLLIDARTADPVGGLAALQERAHSFVELLGPKMGPICALIVPPALANDAALFQAASGEMGVRVGLFVDVPSATAWLETFRTSTR